MSLQYTNKKKEIEIFSTLKWSWLDQLNMEIIVEKTGFIVNFFILSVYGGKI